MFIIMIRLKSYHKYVFNNKLKINNNLFLFVGLRDGALKSLQALLGMDNKEIKKIGKSANTDLVQIDSGTSRAESAE